jgi:hypothetical protein
VADYLCEVHGLFPNGEAWSTSRHITSSQAPATLLTTWKNAWVAAWTDGTHGLNAIYPTGTSLETFVVRTLDAQLRSTAAVSVAEHHAGVDTNTTLPAEISIVVTWRSSTGIGRTKRGHQALPAPAGDVVGNNNLTGPAQTRVSAAMNALKAAITADGSTFFLAPRFDTLHGIPAFTKTVTDIVQCRDKVGRAEKRYRKQASIYV